MKNLTEFGKDIFRLIWGNNSNRFIIVVLSRFIIPKFYLFFQLEEIFKIIRNFF